MITLMLGLIFLRTASSQNLNGIFLTDSCECSSSSEKCEPTGPFILKHQRSTVAIKYGSVQVGVGTLGNNQLDIYLNQSRCKGPWDGETHIAELKCQYQDGIICKTKFRCISGSCLDTTSTIASSTPITRTVSFLFMIGILIMLV